MNASYISFWLHVLGMQLTGILQSDWCATIVAPAQVVYANDTRSFLPPQLKEAKGSGVPDYL